LERGEGFPLLWAKFRPNILPPTHRKTPNICNHNAGVENFQPLRVLKNLIDWLARWKFF
jgi:hypothetical protein